MRSSPSPPVGATGARLWVVAFMLLQRHAQGEDTTRDACVDARVCTQGEWNLINEAFRRLGWKKGYRLTAPPDLSQAWWEWEDRAYISDDDRLWIRTGKQDVEIK